MRDGSLEICFVLPWKTQVFIEYVVTCPRFLKTLSICNTLQYTITIEAPYEFLHDITCLSKKPLKSQYRQNMVSRFWTALTSLTDSDNMLAHFSWFPGMGRTWYNVPDTIKSGMPLFYMTSSLPSSIQLSDAACPQFGQMWQPVISLEPTQWSRWMHSQRVTLVLLHDRPLPKHLHQANQSGRFQCVQYRQAAASLYGMLKTWATFILVENHTYVHFIYREVEKPPISFCLINVSCKSLCVVLNVAFAAGTEGIVRHNIMADLLDRLSQLSLPSRRTEQSQIPCCKILHKPLEKILIRYERMPLNLNTVMFPDGSQIMAKNGAISPASFTTSLSRYLYHTRWLWLLKKPTLVTQPVSALPKPSIAAIARILSTITKRVNDHIDVQIYRDVYIEDTLSLSGLGVYTFTRTHTLVAHVHTSTVSLKKEGPAAIVRSSFTISPNSLHNKELILNAAESDRFTRMLAARPREEGYKYLFCNYDTDDSHVTKTVTSTYPRWRCFVKGISTTHVIVTLVPAAEADVQQLISQPEDESERQNATTPQPIAQGLADSMSDCRQHYVSDGTGGRSETNSPIPRFRIETVENPDLDYFKNALAFSTPKTTSIDVYNEHHATPVISPCNILGLGGETQRRTSLVLPIYVYDCSLALLVDSLVEKLEKPRFRDVRHDYTFRMADQLHQFREEFVGLKSGDNTKPSSPEPKSEDSDNITGDQQNLLEHCKIISLAHCNAYVVSVYKSLIEQQPINYSDMEAAVEQCEECLIEINITDYLRAVCRHLGSEALPPTPLNDTDEDGYGCNDTCKDMRNLHMLIKDKFRKIINVAFKQVSVHPDFYFCLPYGKNDKIAESKDMVSSDSDDEVRFSYTNETLNGKMFGSLKKVASHTGNTMRSSAGITHDRPKLSESSESDESYVSDGGCQDDDEQPLFIQLNCSIHSKTSFSSTAVKLLPTCFTEITQKLEDYNLKDTSSLKVTLDIICLNLPKEVLEVSIENVPAGLRTTSYCSEGSRGGDTSTDGSFDRSSLNRQHGSMHHQMSFETGDPIHENIANLPSHQYTAVTSLVDEINWLLRDETAAVLLDQPDLPSKANLEFIARHVGESRNRSSCYMDKVPLHFVFSAESSLPRFIEELKTLKVDSYSVEKEDEIFYFVKNENVQKEKSCTLDTDSPTPVTVRDEEESKGTMPDDSVFHTEDITQPSVVTSNIVNNNVNSSQIKKQDSGELPGYHSEISSIGDNGQLGTDDGYEGDSSDTEDECQWLVDLDRRRPRLPNFWLILRVSEDHVNVYFHCRFLELSSPEVDRYQQVHKNTVSQIKAICRRVNQYLLLRDLYDKRICDPLLENESAEDNNWKNDSSHDSTPASQTHAHATNTSGSHMTPGMFRCPIVWEVPFCLHHRLKTGPGKTGMSRGIKVLQAVLNRFSVNNRANMFVYQERNKNVFYLRLHERTGDEKSLQSGKLSESDEKIVVSRSSSITSLSQTRIMAQSTDHVSGSSINSELLRPRVRSFGERESDIMNKSGDSIVLMVHGISEAGPEVRYDLVQVLQNRLDDAVLDVLAVMLARNPMCKLTPSDVRFIQRQYRPPECCIRFSVQEPCLSHMAALEFYLRQNILQFVYTPKYTDTRPSSHFQDYSQPESSSKHVPETDIFLYNQSQSSGSRDMESLAKFPTQEHSDNKEWPRPASRVQVPKQSPGLGLTSIQMMDQVMRDAKPSGQYPTNTIDPVVKSAYDFQELRQKDKKIKDDLDKLYAIWQSRNVLTSLPISQSMLNSFKQHSRLIHYCHTPLLFLPMWRIKSAATRDHTLAPPLHQLVQPERSRTASNASSKKQDSTAVIEWHRTICQCMLAEYKQYLQQLGFNPIKIEASGKNKE
ncbi:unnamed protein product [Trichogramma brassicae]|uniref:Protein SZT2 n=1 Tax=Trichogramma brassicae TaxID=86971 RepID=A0A6H5IHT2_9HYME|nr:unnamed protein product [Trichogramma brassicae]